MTRAPLLLPGAVLLGALLSGCAPQAGPTLETPADGGRTGWLLYLLHGRLVEREGLYARDPDHGFYDLRGQMAAFEARGFRVEAPLRPLGASVERYADALVGRIRAEIDGGRAPSHIAVLGFEKGAQIALLAAARLQQPQIATVLLAGCGAGREREVFEGLRDATAGRLRGRLLSLYERSDPSAQSCRELAPLSPSLQFEEQAYRTGAGQGLFFRPRLDWVVRVSRWIRQE